MIARTGILLSEHESFHRLANGLKLAADGARMLALHQPDKAYMWNKMAEVYLVAVQTAYKLNEESALKSAERKLS